MMTVDTESYINDYTGSHPGNELQIIYTVTNTTPGTDPDDRLINFTLSAGSNQGVYDAVAPTDWTFTINADDTFFSTNDTSKYIQPNNGQGVFEIYSTNLGTMQGLAKAASVGNGGFNDVTVDIPAPEPGTMALMALGLFGLMAKRRKGSA